MGWGLRPHPGGGGRNPYSYYNGIMVFSSRRTPLGRTTAPLNVDIHGRQPRMRAFSGAAASGERGRAGSWGGTVVPAAFHQDPRLAQSLGTSSVLCGEAAAPRRGGRPWRVWDPCGWGGRRPHRCRGVSFVRVFAVHESRRGPGQKTRNPPGFCATAQFVTSTPTTPAPRCAFWD